MTTKLQTLKRNVSLDLGQVVLWPGQSSQFRMITSADSFDHRHFRYSIDGLCHRVEWDTDLVEDGQDCDAVCHIGETPVKGFVRLEKTEDGDGDLVRFAAGGSVFATIRIA